MKDTANVGLDRGVADDKRELPQASFRGSSALEATSGATATGLPRRTMAVLMLAVFTVSLGFGIVLPSLPFLIERLLGPGGDAAQVASATGLMTSMYMLSLFLFASAWGRLSDRFGRRPIILIGLIGFSSATMTSALIESMPALYAQRFLSGLFAAAVAPVALATIGDLATNEASRSRRLVFVSLAGVSGVLLGPMASLGVARVVAAILPGLREAGTLAVPLSATAILALAVAGAAAFAIPGKRNPGVETGRSSPDKQLPRYLVPTLLALAFISSAGIGAFEVGLALRGKQELGLTPYQIAAMFTECSLVMIVVQAIVFSPWLRPETTRRFILPAFAILAAGLFLVPSATDYKFMLAVTGAVAASVGILTPILTYWISSKAGGAQGTQLGRQAAVASLGAAVGSAAGGLLFNVAWPPGASFVFPGVLAALAVVLSLGLSRKLWNSSPMPATRSGA